jgi:hypothetical protein
MEDLPASAANYADDEMRILVGLCYETSKLTGGVFFLSSHDAAERLKVAPKTAWRMLKILVGDGVLALIQKGNQRRATRYKWIGGNK